MSSLQVRIDGTWLTSIAAWGDLAYSHAWPGGCKEASLGLTSRYGAHPRIIRPGAVGELRRGPRVIWSGRLQEPDWNGKDAQLTFQGPSGEGDGYTALDAAGNATINPRVAVEQAIARGLQWRLDASIPNIDMVGASEEVYTVSGLLTAFATTVGQRWGVDAHRRVFMAYDRITQNTAIVPTGSTPILGPDYHARPGTADLAVALDNYASHMVVRYDSVTTGLNETAAYPPLGSAPSIYEQRYGHLEWTKAITSLGPMTEADAIGIAQSIYTLTRQKPGWSNGLALLPGELLTATGQRVDQDTVRENRIIRVHGVRDEITHKPWIDFTTGGTNRIVAEKQLNADPVNLAVRNQEDAYTELYEGDGDDL